MTQTKYNIGDIICWDSSKYRVSPYDSPPKYFLIVDIKDKHYYYYDYYKSIFSSDKIYGVDEVEAISCVA